MFRTTLVIVFALACAVLAVAPSGLAATSPAPNLRGNSSAASLCRSWSEAMKYGNIGECISTSARLVAPRPSLIDPIMVCESFGGTFEYATDNPQHLWTCSVPDPLAHNLRNEVTSQMYGLCIATGGAIPFGGWLTYLGQPDVFDPNFDCWGPNVPT